MWGYLFAFLGMVAAPLVSSVLRGLGFGFVTYIGMTGMFTVIESQINAHFAGMPAAMFQMISLMGIPKALNIIFSGFVAMMTIKRFINDTGAPVKRGVWRGPNGGIGGGGA